MRKIYNALPLLFVMLTGLGIQSCKKEYLDEKRPDNNIEQFVIATGAGDSTKCLIQGDTIKIYFNPDAIVPATITPSIVVSEKATVSPVSKTAVPLNNNTTFTVTAENGQVRTYQLKVVQSVPTPNVSYVTPSIIWLNSSQIDIYGEYFLTGTDTSKISAFLRRVSDGFEFPLTINKKQVSNYTIVANMPAFSAEQGIGLHQLFIKTGDRTSKGMNINLYAPAIFNVSITSSLVQDGQDIHAGDSLTINYQVNSTEYNGKIAEFYNTQQIATVSLYFGFEQTVDITEFTRTATTIKFKVPETINKYIGQSLATARLYFKTVSPDWTTSSSYRNSIFFAKPCPVKAKN